MGFGTDSGRLRLAARALASAAMLAGAAGCLSVKTKSEIAPIHITMDVNVKVDRELENFFGDIDER